MKWFGWFRRDTPRVCKECHTPHPIHLSYCSHAPQLVPPKKPPQPTFLRNPKISPSVEAQIQERRARQRREQEEIERKRQEVSDSTNSLLNTVLALEAVENTLSTPDPTPSSDTFSGGGGDSGGGGANF